VAAARLCHKDLLWPDEDYRLAAAIQILHGKALYRDVWYEKPRARIVANLRDPGQRLWSTASPVQSRFGPSEVSRS